MSADASPARPRQGVVLLRYGFTTRELAKLFSARETHESAEVVAVPDTGRGAGKRINLHCQREQAVCAENVGGEIAASCYTNPNTITGIHQIPLA